MKKLTILTSFFCATTFGQAADQQEGFTLEDFRTFQQKSKQIKRRGISHGDWALWVLDHKKAWKESPEKSIQVRKTLMDSVLAKCVIGKKNTPIDKDVYYHRTISDALNTQNTYHKKEKALLKILNILGDPRYGGYKKFDFHSWIRHAAALHDKFIQTNQEIPFTESQKKRHWATVLQALMSRQETKKRAMHDLDNVFDTQSNSHSSHSSEKKYVLKKMEHHEHDGNLFPDDVSASSDNDESDSHSSHSSVVKYFHKTSINSDPADNFNDEEEDSSEHETHKSTSKKNFSGSRNHKENDSVLYDQAQYEPDSSEYDSADSDASYPSSKQQSPSISRKIAQSEVTIQSHISKFDDFFKKNPVSDKQIKSIRNVYILLMQKGADLDGFDKVVTGFLNDDSNKIEGLSIIEFPDDIITTLAECYANSPFKCKKIVSDLGKIYEQLDTNPRANKSRHIEKNSMPNILAYLKDIYLNHEDLYIYALHFLENFLRINYLPKFKDSFAEKILSHLFPSDVKDFLPHVEGSKAKALETIHWAAFKLIDQIDLQKEKLTNQDVQILLSKLMKLYKNHHDFVKIIEQLIDLTFFDSCEEMAYKFEELSMVHDQPDLMKRVLDGYKNQQHEKWEASVVNGHCHTIHHFNNHTMEWIKAFVEKYFKVSPDKEKISFDKKQEEIKLSLHYQLMPLLNDLTASSKHIFNFFRINSSMENSLAVKGHLKEFLMRDPKKIVQTEYAKHLATLEGIVNNLKTDHHPLCDQLKLFINSEQERALQFVGKLEADALKLEWFNAGQKIHN